MTRLPLYREACAQPWEMPDDGNAGLWYTKFCSTWKDDWRGLRDPVRGDRNRGIAPYDGGRLDWLLRATKEKVGDSKLLKQYAARTRALVEARKGLCQVIATTEYFVTGLGLPHPIENGFSWHYSLGVPWLPGSGVKGVARAWARDWDNTASQERIDTILGSQAQAAAVDFLPLLPIEPVRLAIDGTTPHYGDYYQKGKTPGDWLSPNPVVWLAVARGARFLLAVVPRRIDGSSSESLSDSAVWLQHALTSVGAGAVTAVDHGRFQGIRTVVLSRREVEHKLAHPPQGGQWRLAIDPETHDARIVAQDTDGFVSDVAGHEDLFPLGMAVERTDGCIEGGDWVVASTPDRRAHDGVYRSYWVIWDD